jgi:hypothetical protein
MQHEHKGNSDMILRRLKKTLSNEIFEGVFLLPKYSNS